MGLVIEVSFCHDWKRIYFVQNMNETEAKEKALKMFKQTMSCYLPNFNNNEKVIEAIMKHEHIVQK